MNQEIHETVDIWFNQEIQNTVVFVLLFLIVVKIQMVSRLITMNPFTRKLSLSFAQKIADHVQTFCRSEFAATNFQVIFKEPRVYGDCNDT